MGASGAGATIGAVPTYTLAQLRTKQTEATIAARLTAALGSAGLPVADWAPIEQGGIELTVVSAVAGALASILGPKLVKVAEGRFLDLAEGPWLTQYAKSRYLLDRGAATYTIQNIRLTSSVGDSFQAGDLWVAGAGGNRYRSIDAVTLVAGQPKDISFQAENPGSAYADVAETVTKLITAPAGLTARNVRPSEFAAAQLSGFSSGKVTGAFVNPAVRPTFDSVTVRIDTPGQVGAALFSYSLDGGQTWPVTGVPAAPSVVVGGSAVLSFSNGIAPSFIQGDLFTLLVGDAILQRGADEESDVALRDRCRDRWATLSDVPTDGLVTLWCHLASPEVSTVRVGADPNRPGGILVVVASASGPASPQARLAVQEYVAARLRGYQGVPAPTDPTVGGSPEEHALCSSATPREIQQTGLVSVPRSKLATVQVEADRLWAAYLATVEIGGVVRATELVQAIMDAGATDVSDVMLGLPLLPMTNVALAPSEVAVLAAGASLTTTMTWRPL